MIREVLPNEYFAPIQEFHVTHSLQGAERFEYLRESKHVHFFFPVEKKTPEVMNEAVTELLLGLARIKSTTNWGYPLSKNEREEHSGFIEKWSQKCVLAMT